jgi:hypothetical protein
MGLFFLLDDLIEMENLNSEVKVTALHSQY